MGFYSLSIISGELIDWFMSLFRKDKVETVYGLSFDSGIKMKSLPVRPDIALGGFAKYNKQVGIMEVLEINHDKQTVFIREICTDNEFTISIDVFNFLFIEQPCPAECKMP